MRGCEAIQRFFLCKSKRSTLLVIRNAKHLLWQLKNKKKQKEDFCFIKPRCCKKDRFGDAPREGLEGESHPEPLSSICEAKGQDKMKKTPEREVYLYSMHR